MGGGGGQDALWCIDLKASLWNLKMVNDQLFGEKLYCIVISSISQQETKRGRDKVHLMFTR